MAFETQCVNFPVVASGRAARRAELFRESLPDKAERWDRASVHEFEGTYGDYLLDKVAKVFPQLKEAALG